jgi:hypothetical protein
VSTSGIALAPSAKALPRSLVGHVRLLVGPRGLARLRRSLHGRRLLSARVTIVAVGPTGRRTTLVRHYVVAR